MILYRPTDGDVHGSPLRWRPKTAFLMAQLGGDVPEIVLQIRHEIQKLLAEIEYTMVDADSVTTGKDFLLKIWQLVLSVPAGIAVIHEGISHSTIANIFYELGWMQAYGKESIVIKAGKVQIPSDFVRTEYVPFDRNFERRFRSFMTELGEQATFYATMAEQVENNPLLAVDYLRRAYLLSGDVSIKERTKEIVASAGFEGRARNSVEMLLANF